MANVTWQSCANCSNSYPNPCSCPARATTGTGSIVFNPCSCTSIPCICVGTSTSISGNIQWYSSPLRWHKPTIIISKFTDKDTDIYTEDFKCHSCKKQCTFDELEMVYKKTEINRYICRDCLCDKLDGLFGIKMGKEDILFKKDKK